MKLILSRKGLDSSFGAVPNPILPDGRLCWLPIPESSSFKPSLPSYRDLKLDGASIGDLIVPLTNGGLSPSQTVHLDPDLQSTHMPRLPGWRPAFGQTGAAERHLLNCGVGPGDIFLFFGWFKETTYSPSGLRYAPGAPDMHLIYGWLQISSRMPVDMFFDGPTWLADHPHAQGSPYSKVDSIYLSQDSISGFDDARQCVGAGTFSHFHRHLVLTAPDGPSRSVWRLPEDFFPGERSPLTYHSKSDRWTRLSAGTELRTVGRGQEFVLNLGAYHGVRSWLQGLLLGDELSPLRPPPIQAEVPPCQTRLINT